MPAKPKPPSLEILDARLTGALTRARSLDDIALKEARALRERLRQGEDHAAIVEAFELLTKYMDTVEDLRRGQ